MFCHSLELPYHRVWWIHMAFNSLHASGWFIRQEDKWIQIKPNILFWDPYCLIIWFQLCKNEDEKLIILLFIWVNPYSAGNEFIYLLQTVKTQIRGLLEEPSDQGLYCLTYFHIFAIKPLICQNELVKLQNWNIPF